MRSGKGAIEAALAAGRRSVITTASGGCGLRFWWMSKAKGCRFCEDAVEGVRSGAGAQSGRLFVGIARFGLGSRCCLRQGCDGEPNVAAGDGAGGSDAAGRQKSGSTKTSCRSVTLPPSAYGRTLRMMRCWHRSHWKRAYRRADCMIDGAAAVCAEDGQLLAVPLQPAPRRSTGPDLGQLLSLWDDQVTLVGATLRVERHLPVRPTLTLGLTISGGAAAILLARRWHGGWGSGVQLLSRAL